MTQNSINNNSDSFSALSLTIDPGASGDSYVQFDINSINEFRIGIDDDADDAFVISQGGSLGTNNTFIMSASGENTKPLNPTFLGVLDSQDDNVTGDNTTWQLGSGTALTERLDYGSDFNTNGTFTAPVTGYYCLQGNITFDAPSASGTQTLCSFITSNATYFFGSGPTRNQVTNYFGVNGDIGLQGGVLADLDAADTATLNFQCGNAAKTTDVTDNSWFSGALIA